MRASILIPAFNASGFIQATLKSCLDQGQDYIEEIIVVDDHSQDDTVSVVQKFIQQNPTEIPIQLASNPKKGACSARNYAFMLSKGAAIQWLDADDLLGQGKLARQLKLLKAHPNHLIASRWRRFKGDLDTLWPEETGPWASVPISSSPLEWLLAERMMIPAGWLGSRVLFSTLSHQWDERLLLNQDGEYFTRAVAASEGVLFEPESCVYYRTEESASVSTFHPSKAESLYQAAESFERTVLGIGSFQRVQTLIANQYMGFIYRVYPHVPELRAQARRKIREYGPANRANDVAESSVAKIIAAVFGWKALVQMRLLRSKLLG
jgi:glycosyltransferase involved in cell wall biosynthesis